MKPCGCIRSTCDLRWSRRCPTVGSAVSPLNSISRFNTRRHERLRVLAIGYAVRDEDHRIKGIEGAFQKLGTVINDKARA